MSTRPPRKHCATSISIHPIISIRRNTAMARAASPIRPVARLGTLIIVAVIAIALLVLTLSAWRSINPGFVGIVFDKANHNVTAGALDPGWAFINPFTQAIQQYPV